MKYYQRSPKMQLTPFSIIAISYAWQSLSIGTQPTELRLMKSWVGRSGNFTETITEKRKQNMAYYEKIVLSGERPQSWNVLKRMHWSKWQVEVERCKWLILDAIGIQREPLAFPVNLVFRTYYKNRPFDTSNFPEKLYEDGLVAAGLLVDDNRNYVYDIKKCKPEIDKQHPRVEIEINEAV